MADDAENDDQWLYGDAPDLPKIDERSEEPEPPDNTEDQPEEAPQPEPEPEQTSESNEQNAEETSALENADSPEKENGDDEEEDKQNGDGSDKDDSDDDSDDDVNVVIGDIKTSPSYTSLNIKRSGILSTSGPGDKSGKQAQPQPGKFNVEEFDQMGTINGVPASEFNLDSLEDKPWRKPGADITDYFNYGFNEDTWRAYCERQKRLRINESGVGLAPMNAIGMPRGPVPIMNDNSKYSGNFIGARKAGPPPGRRMTGSIDVIGGGAASRVGAPASKLEAPKENVIQVMTADRREYSRKPPGFPDMSMPPPTAFEEFQPEYGFNPEPDPYFGGYEPTQDSQWGPDGHPPPWATPQDVKPLPLGPGAPLIPSAVPPVNMGPPGGSAQAVPAAKESPPLRREDREREASRGRSEKSRDRERERSHRRERSRSRSRRHKSRSRSPSHRSHRKKKSRRHEDSD